MGFVIEGEITSRVHFRTENSVINELSLFLVDSANPSDADRQVGSSRLSLGSVNTKAKSWQLQIYPELLPAIYNLPFLLPAPQLGSRAEQRPLALLF